VKRLGDRQKLGAVLLLHAVVGAFVFRYGTDLHDEGLLYATASRFVDGQIPYTDFYLVQAPGAFYVQAALIKIFGLSFLAGRIFKQVQGLVVVWLSYRIVLRATGDSRSALVAAIASAMFSAAHHFRLHWYTTDACILVLVALWAACAWLDSRRLLWVLAAGAATGGAMLFKQNHGIVAMTAIGVVLTWDAWGRDSDADARRRTGSAARVGAVLLFGFVASLALYLAYYSLSGGSLRLLWMNCFVWASEAKNKPSPIDLLVYPLKVFTLLHKRHLSFPATALALLCGLGLALSSRVPKWARALGALISASTVAMGAEVFVRAYVWSLGSALVFAIAAAAALEAALTPVSSPRATRVRSCALVALVAAANLYAGTMPGGGWGRLVETLSGTLLAFGIAAYLLTDQNGLIGRWWSQNVWVSPRLLGLAFAGASLAVSTGLLVKNQAFRPALDVELKAMTGEARATGWRGIRGDPLYVQETDAIVTALRSLPEERRNSVYVFPLNCAIYPLAEVRNPTRFDSAQSDFLAPSQFDELLAELQQYQPPAIVLQRHANPSFRPNTDDLAYWVRPEIRRAVEDFVHRHYQLSLEWTHYELWTLRSSTDS
jgi:4-amino-4-deoxy-L-arabinose transferase-like glycosyltransferase